MTDYTKTTNFTAKDALATGNALKVIKGSYFDTEYDNLATAIATKYDSADLATQGEAEAGTNNVALMTPLRTEQWSATWAAENGGMVADIQALADPDADRILGWDESANAAIAFTIGSGLTSTTTSIHIADVAAGAAQPWSITSGTVAFSLGGITEITGPNLSQSGDGFLISDAGVLKVMPIDQAGILVATPGDAIQTFAITDANTLQYLTGTTTRVWTIPANATVAFEIGTAIICQNSGTGLLTLTAAANVIIDSIFHTAGATAQSDSVSAGGMAVLIKTGTDTWALSGDIVT